jgi:hypothetical protein
MIWENASKEASPFFQEIFLWFKLDFGFGGCLKKSVLLSWEKEIL